MQIVWPGLILSLFIIFFEEPYKSYLIQAQQLALDAARSASTSCSGLPETGTQLSRDVYTHNNNGCSYYTVYPSSNCESVAVKKITDSLQSPNFPLLPQLQIYAACSSPNCPPGKKVWVQVVWASPSGNFSDPKGCFIIAYSQDAPTLPPKIEYNPFLSEQFVRDRAISYYLVDGDRFRGLRDNNWKNLESVSGWDKGYWKSEQTDSECRGWRPGWSRKIKLIIMNYYLSLLFKAFKVGIIFNIITWILAAIYVFCVESYFQPFQLKSPPVL
jgi:hypothetical protein